MECINIPVDNVRCGTVFDDIAGELGSVQFMVITFGLHVEY